MVRVVAAGSEAAVEHAVLYVGGLEIPAPGGRGVLEGLAAGTHDVIASARGFRTGSVLVDLADGEERTVTVELTPR